MPNVPVFLPFVGGEMGLGAVLDEVEVVPVADLLDGLDVDRLAEEVDRDDRPWSSW